MKSKVVIGTRHWIDEDTFHVDGDDSPLVDNQGLLHPVDLVCDVRSIPLPSAQFEYGFSSEVLEHVSWKETAQVVVEWARLIQPEGTLRIETPDFLAACQQVLSADTLEMDLAIQQIIFGGHLSLQWDAHFAGLTHRTLPLFMEQAGLTITGVWRGYEVGWLRVDGQKPCT